MKLESLSPAKGSIHNSKRVGRGQGSGKGGTSKKGHKGQKSRSGYSRKIGFEGGQMPLQRRLPKFGFTNINRVEYKAINLDVLQRLVDEKKISTEAKHEDFVNNGLCSKRELVKILGRGELNTKLTVHAHKVSETAKANIEKAGGTVNIIEK